MPDLARLVTESQGVKSLLIPMFRTVAIVLLVIGNAAVFIGIAWYTWRVFVSKTGAASGTMVLL